MPSFQGELETGDVVFIRVDNPLYRRVAAATSSWTSHVGIVVDPAAGREIVAESTFPFSKNSPLPKFLARSEGGKFSVKRLQGGLSDSQKERVRAEAAKRLGILYHLGFDLDSSRQYCSKFVHEVLRDAVGVHLGSVETFRELVASNPENPRWFWYLWYFGFIPWRRRTVTPASQYRSPLLQTVRESL